QCVRKSWNRAAEVYRQYVLSLHTGTEVTPGIYTYKLFWFRDAAYILSALYNWNYVDHARSVLDTYPRRMDKNGFFRSQDGEWDSNGQAIWTLVNFARTIGDTDFLARVYPAIRRGAEWIIKKRREGLVQKILPAGFSAEHLGPADYYYWDNLWSVAGLRDAASVAEQLNHTRDYRHLQTELTKYKNDLLIISAEDRERHGVLPAAPGRGLDAGMIGNVCLLYPLQLDLFAPEEVERTIHCIQSRFCKNDLFFQSMIHSGYNIYLSIQLAQCFFRMGDVSTARRIFKKVLKSRTQLWTYPEAIHPHTGGGVMGDGFHGWAFAEILLLLREFVLHVDENRDIHIFRGMGGKELVGPTRLEFGPFPVQGVNVHISGHMRHTSGTIDLKITTPQGTPGRLKRVHLHLPTDDGAGRTVRIENPSLKGARLGERRNQTFVLRNLADRVRFRF
ncbi:MAG: hypothetical protein KDK30_17870, partial [Leptospiraceae bacterium]|nr:hypothetical protein [Leptospiraceae bacterium]